MRGLSRIGHGAILIFALAACTSDPATSRARIVALYYAAGVATYCSGLTEQAVAGLQRAVELERVASPLDETEMIAARNRGYVAADYEWSNRGLGGFRRWCLSEGAASIRWLEGLVNTPDAPLPPAIRQPATSYRPYEQTRAGNDG